MKLSTTILTGIILALTIPLLVACNLGEMEWCIEGPDGCFKNAETPSVPPLKIADYNDCLGNHLGGEIDIFADASESIQMGYLELAPGECALQLTYDIQDWAAYWLILGGVDFTPYHHLVFDVRSESDQIGPQEFKVELKNQLPEGQIIKLFYVDDITSDWQTVEIHLSDFEPADGGDSILDMSRVDELVFVFESSYSGNQGILYLDNMMLTP
jgi:hypothetical protein